MQLLYKKIQTLRVVLISLRKGATLHEHQVEGPLTLFVAIRARLMFIVEEEEC